MGRTPDPVADQSRDDAEPEPLGWDFPQPLRKRVAYKFVKWSDRRSWRAAMPGLWEAGNRVLAKELQEELSDRVYGQEVPPHGFGEFVVGGLGIRDDPGRVLQAFLEPEDDAVRCLRVVAIALQVLERWSEHHHDPMTAHRAQAQHEVALLVGEVNALFAEGGIPWRYANHALVPMGEPLLNDQVESTLRCLAGPDLAQVDQEFRRALEHLGARRAKESITAAG